MEQMTTDDTTKDGAKITPKDEVPSRQRRRELLRAWRGQVHQGATAVPPEVRKARNRKRSKAARASRKKNR